MSGSPSATVRPGRRSVRSRHLRLAVLGPPAWLETSGPPELTSALQSLRLPVVAGGDVGAVLEAAWDFAPQISVVIDPCCLPVDALVRLPGTTLGMIVNSPAMVGPALGPRAGALDRVLAFHPRLLATELGGSRLWRAIPPPINDALYGDVRALRERPRVLTVGSDTPHREYMLLPAKHHHDVLQLIHGVTGTTLVDTLRTYDVGVYVTRGAEPGFGAQVGMHLAAGQLLFAAGLEPTHGLERGIDYVQFGTPAELVALLDRLRRFPDMYQRIRIRGRMKAERYRASTLFARLACDLVADVAAFGASRAGT